MLRVQDRQGQANVLEEGPGGNGPVFQPRGRPDLRERVRIVAVERCGKLGPDTVGPLRIKARQRRLPGDLRRAGRQGHGSEQGFKVAAAVSAFTRLPEWIRARWRL